MIDSTRSIGGRCIAQMRYTSPLGSLLLARTEAGLAGAWFDKQKHHPAPIGAPERDDDALLQRAASELDAYFAGAEGGFDVPLTCTARRSSAPFGASCSGSSPAPPAPMATSRGAWARPRPAAPWAPRSGAIPSRSSCPAIASSAATARSPATPGDCRARRHC